MEQSNHILTIKLNAHKPPVFKEEKNKEWVVMGTDKDWYNNYPGYLLKLYDTSHLHGSIINAKVHYICGNGLEIDTKGLNIENQALLMDKLNRANERGETILDVMKKCVLDKQLFNTFYLEIIWNRAGTDFDYFHFPYESLREDKDGDGYWYSDDWSKSQQSEDKTGLKWMPKADIEGRKNGILAFKIYKPGCKNYTKVDYLPGIAYIEADGEVANYNLQGIKSQFNIGTIISFNNGTPTEEEKDYIEKKLKEKFTGTDASNSVLINFSKTKDNAPTIERMQSPDFADQYKDLKNQIVEAIIQTHRFPPILAGIQVAGKLGNSQEYNDALETLKVSYLIPEQKLIEDFFNDLLEIKGFAGRIRLKQPEKVQAQWSEATLKDVMTKNEIRESIGLEPIEEPKPVVSSMVHHFSDVLDVFERFGVNADEFEVVESIPMEFADLEKLIYRDILVAIRESPLMSDEQLAQLLKKPLKSIKDALNYLEEQEYIKTKRVGSVNLEGGKDKIESRVINKKAAEILKENPPKLDQYEIMYYYDWRPDVPDSQRDTIAHPSRDFCKRLLRLNKLYSESDLKEISSIVGWDVIRHRGGWWNDEGTNRPYCRHLWYTKKVKKK